MKGSSPCTPSSPEVSLKSLHSNGQFLAHEQPNLFTQAEKLGPGSLNHGDLVRTVLTESMRRSEKSRDQVAEEVTRLVGEKVTVRMLNSYTSEAAEMHRWPLQYTSALCFVLQDWRLLRAIAEESGFYLITAAEKQLLDLGATYLTQKRATEKMESLEKGLRGIEL